MACPAPQLPSPSCSPWHAVNARSRLHGRYPAVQLVSLDLIGGNEEAARVLNALASVS